MINFPMGVVSLQRTTVVTLIPTISSSGAIQRIPIQNGDGIDATFQRVVSLLQIVHVGVFGVTEIS